MTDIGKSINNKNLPILLNGFLYFFHISIINQVGTDNLKSIKFSELFSVGGDFWKVFSATYYFRVSDCSEKPTAKRGLVAESATAKPERPNLYYYLICYDIMYFIFVMYL